MTEAEWLACEEPLPMVAHVCAQLGATRTKIGRRKLRLFSCACLRLVWDLLADPREREAVAVCERFAEGQATAAELEAARRAAFAHALNQSSFATNTGFAINYAAGKSFTENAVTRSIRSACVARCVGPRIKEGGVPTDSAEWRAAARAQADLLREVFGTSGHSTFSPAWRTDNAVTLARQMYESRDFGAMPILADALQDAGCYNDDILTHCRDANQPHVRGCWVVDLVLGK
jgi:hypothetical protein